MRSPASAGLKEALGQRTTSRDLIKSVSFERTTSHNRAIRQALGLRDDGGRRPKFNSDTVKALYKQLEPAAMGLAVDSPQRLLQAWDNQVFTGAVTRVANEFGPKIWIDAMDKRYPNIENSQLLVRGEQEYCTQDLFWEFEVDRDFISLQLEHLLFMRAFAHYRNHRNDEDPTFIVILRFSEATKHARQQLLRKRKRQAHRGDKGAKVSHGRPRRPLGGRVMSVSSDENDDGDETDEKNDPDHTDDDTCIYGLNPQTPASLYSMSSNNLVRSSASSPLPVQQQTTIGGPPTPYFLAGQSDGTQSYSATDPAIPLILTRPTIDTMPDTEMTTPLTQTLTPVESPPDSNLHSNANLAKMRYELIIEVSDELYGESAPSQPDRVNETMTSLWEAQKETIRREFGEEKYREVNEAVESWLQWRQVAATLGMGNHEQSHTLLIAVN